MYRRMIAAGFGAILLTSAASAQTPAQAPPPLNLTGVATGWVKVCQGNPAAGGGCVISNETFLENGSALGSVGIQETGGERRRRRVVLVVPHGMWIEDGVQFRVDNSPPVTAPYGTCLANGCFAAFDLTDAQLQQMRRGRQVTVTVREPSQRAVNIGISLDTFAAVYDGAPMSEEAVAARTRSFQQEMQRRQQGAAAPAGTSAPVAPPAAGAPTAGSAAPRAPNGPQVAPTVPQVAPTAPRQ